jgi:hypothetical protein
VIARLAVVLALLASAGTASAFGLPAASPGGSFTIVAGGDVALNGQGATASTFAGIRQFLHGDIVFANLEGTLATGGSPKCAPYGASGCFTFRAEPASATELRRSGFTLMNVANNHDMDYGASAQSQTMSALRSAHIAFDGLPGQVSVVPARKLRVAFIGAAPYPWAQSLLDIAATAKLVRQAAGLADVVIVYMHAGAEGSSADHVPTGPETFLGEERGNPRAFAHAMIDAGAALVLASGPHTLRGMEWYHGHLIAYSLGNLAGDNTLSTSGTLSVSALLSVTLTSTGALTAAKVIPLRLVGPGTPEYDPSGSAVSMIGTLSDDDFGTSGVRLSANGALAVPKPRAR